MIGGRFRRAGCRLAGTIFALDLLDFYRAPVPSSQGSIMADTAPLTVESKGIMPVTAAESHGPSRERSAIPNRTKAVGTPMLSGSSWRHLILLT
jgi:hypothetical protein